MHCILVTNNKTDGTDDSSEERYPCIDSSLYSLDATPFILNLYYNGFHNTNIVYKKSSDKSRNENLKFCALFSVFAFFRLVNVRIKIHAIFYCIYLSYFEVFRQCAFVWLIVLSCKRSETMDFDDAKENIQPLASGRNAERLEIALNAESHHEIHEQIMEQRREFERAIDSYDGDDPLDIWYDYIQWIEQSYPKSGKETALNEVIASCLSKFEHDERYKQDRRMIKLFIKYVSGFVC